MHYLLLPLFVLAVALGGCADDLPVATQGGSTIMPLAVGNRWSGVTTLYENGAVSSQFQDSVRIVSALERDGFTWYVDDDGLLCRTDETGLHPSVSCECLALNARYPAAPGDTFSTVRVLVLLPSSQVPVEQVVAWQVVSVDTLITVPAGTFHCYHYRTVLFAPQDARLLKIQSTFYAVDVGPVLLEAYDNDGSAPLILSRWELSSYHLE